MRRKARNITPTKRLPACWASRWVDCGTSSVPVSRCRRAFNPPAAAIGFGPAKPCMTGWRSARLRALHPAGVTCELFLSLCQFDADASCCGGGGIAVVPGDVIPACLLAEGVIGIVSAGIQPSLFYASGKPARRRSARIVSSVSVLRIGQRWRNPETVIFGASSSSLATAARASSMRPSRTSADASTR